MDELPTPPPDLPEFPTPQQKRILWTALTALAVLALLGVAALVFLGFISFLSWSYPILLPIGLAMIIALVLEPFVLFFEKRKCSRPTASLLVCALAVVAFLIFWAFLLPPIIRQAGDFFESLPGNINKGLALIQTNLGEADVTPSASTLPTSVATNPAPDVASPPALASTNIAPASPATTTATLPHKKHPSDIQLWLNANIPSIQQTVEKNVASLLYSALGPVGQAFGFILGFSFVPIYVFYFLADQDRIAKSWRDFVPIRRSALRDEVIATLEDINTSLVSYLRGQIVVAACNGVLTVIGLWLIGIPYSLVLGIIAGALSIVPFLGIIASIVPALLLGFLSAKGDPTWQWLSPLLVVVVFALVQMCESLFITPRVQSHSTGLHPLAIIIGILFWSLLLPGLLGPVVAVPLTCTMVVLFRRYVW